MKVQAVIERVAATIKAYVDRRFDSLHEIVKSIPSGKDGINGADGKDGRDGTNGLDGKDGVDGRSVTIEECEAVFRKFYESSQAQWALDFERRAQSLFQKAIESMPKPIDGKDGRDALSIDSFDLSLEDGGRALRVKLQAGETVIEKRITTEFPVYRGLWREGSYRKGDEVVLGGSSWIALSDTDGKPEQSKDWGLRTKRGRDGRDGRNGIDKTAAVRL